jgi:hypothetical protein
MLWDEGENADASHEQAQSMLLDYRLQLLLLFRLSLQGWFFFYYAFRAFI